MPATTVLIPDLRQGTYESDDLDYVPGANVVLTGLVSADDQAAAGNVAECCIQASFDGGKSFHTQSSYTWTSPQLDRQGNPSPPLLLWQPGNLAPDKVRGVVTLPAVLSIGLSLDQVAQG